MLAVVGHAIYSIKQELFLTPVLPFMFIVVCYSFSNDTSNEISFYSLILRFYDVVFGKFYSKIVIEWRSGPFLRENVVCILYRYQNVTCVNFAKIFCCIFQILDQSAISAIAEDQNPKFHANPLRFADKKRNFVFETIVERSTWP